MTKFEVLEQRPEKTGRGKHAAFIEAVIRTESGGAVKAEGDQKVQNLLQNAVRLAVGRRGTGLVVKSRKVSENAIAYWVERKNGHDA
jgi:hypothetical protein